MERIQIDLIDMRHSPDGDFNYIGHFEDHMTKSHILFPLRDKSANEVATMIEERVLAYVGPPHIFHSDNGREFVNQLLHSLLDTWSSGNVTFVNGRPRHSQSQALVERGNRTVQEKIAAIKNDEGFAGKMSFPWVSWLPRIMYSINTQVHTTTKEMPYKLVFGQIPRSQLFLLQNNILLRPGRLEDGAQHICCAPTINLHHLFYFIQLIVGAPIYKWCSTNYQHFLHHLSMVLHQL